MPKGSKRKGKKRISQTKEIQEINKIKKDIQVLDDLLRSLDEQSLEGPTYTDKEGRAIQYPLLEKRDALVEKLKKLEKVS